MFNILAFPEVHNFVTKEGSRREWKLDINDSFVQSIVKQLPINKPLRFASLMQAMPTEGPSQRMHKDASNDEQMNAIVYLTDVADIINGPIEFENGPVLGPKGTTVVYHANDMHRGVANRSSEERLALTMAFSDEERNIMTIGAPTTVLTDMSWTYKVALGVFLALLVLHVYYNY
jgi:hypothetical protein